MFILTISVLKIIVFIFQNVEQNHLNFEMSFLLLTVASGVTVE